MKLLNFFKQDFTTDDYEMDTPTIEKQINKRLKKQKRELENIILEKDELKDKYISVLEDKARGFDQYLYWEDKSAEIDAENKELKKNYNALKKQLKDFNDVIKDIILCKKNDDIKKVREYNEFLSYLLYSHYQDKELDMELISSKMKELLIEKEDIKDTSEYLYEILGIEKWKVEEHE